MELPDVTISRLQRKCEKSSTSTCGLERVALENAEGKSSSVAPWVGKLYSGLSVQHIAQRVALPSHAMTSWGWGHMHGDHARSSSSLHHVISLSVLDITGQDNVTLSSASVSPLHAAVGHWFISVPLEQ